MTSLDKYGKKLREYEGPGILTLSDVFSLKDLDVAIEYLDVL